MRKWAILVQLAYGYREKPMYLIGPSYYDLYLSLIKMIIPISVTISLISLVAEYVFTPVEGSSFINMLLTIIGEGICRVITVAMQVFFWVTIVFAIMERVDIGRDSHPLTTNKKNWTADDLKQVTSVPKNRAIPRWEVYVSLLWTAIWATIYFNADRLLGIYENQGDGLTFVTPSMNQDVLLSFWPGVILVIGLEISLALYKLWKAEWSKGLAWFNAVQEITATVLFIWILSAEGLFQEAFITYTSDLFNVTATQVENSIIWGATTIFISFAIWNIIDGFIKYKRGLSKSSMKNDIGNLN